MCLDCVVIGSLLGVLLAQCLLINGGVLAAVMPLLLANKDNGVHEPLPVDKEVFLELG